MTNFFFSWDRTCILSCHSSCISSKIWMTRIFCEVFKGRELHCYILKFFIPISINYNYCKCKNRKTVFNTLTCLMFSNSIQLLQNCYLWTQYLQRKNCNRYRLMEQMENLHTISKTDRVAMNILTRRFNCGKETPALIYNDFNSSSSNLACYLLDCSKKFLSNAEHDFDSLSECNIMHRLMHWHNLSYFLAKMPHTFSTEQVSNAEILLGSLGCFCCSWVLLTYAAFPDIRKLTFMKLIMYVAVNDFFASLGFAMGSSDNFTFQCIFQAFATDFNYLSSLFWSTVISHQVF